jgi:D-aspartate ligase
MNATVTMFNDVRPVPEIKSATTLPPVIVLNLFHSGLGIIRQLAGTGVRVIGLSANARIYGNYTRLCEVLSSPDSQEQPDQLASFLQSLAVELEGAVIFPTRDADLLFLDRFRADLEPLYRLAIPPSHILDHVMDKATLARIALDIGIPIPRTTTVANSAKLKSAAHDIGFPCLLKPVRSIHWREEHRWKTVGGRKAFRAANYLELENHYRRIAQVYPEFLLQEWIPGGTDNLLIWGGHIGPQYDPVISFTARKLIQSPAEFGTGCVVQSELLPDLLEPSVRLCRAFAYEGIAEIEYKQDPRDGTLKLIEINARHWDWHELGKASHVNLTWAAYCRLVGRPVDAAPTATQSAKWIAEDIFVKHCLASLWEKTSDRSSVTNAIAGERIYGMFAWNDPLPCIRYSSCTLLPALAVAASKKIRKRIFNKAVTRSG